MNPRAGEPDVTVIGGGVAGLSVGWELARRGRRIAIYDAGATGSATSAVATSYLEPRLGSTPARKLEWASLRLWPSVANALTAETGIDIGFRPEGQWRYAFAEDEADVRLDYEERRVAGWNVSWMDGDELRCLEPAIGPDVTGAATIRDPAWVDGPALCRALAFAIRSTPGCSVHENAPMTDSKLPEGGDIVVATGGSAELDLSHLGLPPVQRTKGTTLFYRDAPPLSRMLRHKTLSIVPRSDGVVVGSSRERGATSLAPDASVVEGLHAKAVRIMPVLADIKPEPRCGFRAMIGDGSLNLGRSGRFVWSLSHAGVGYLRAPLVACELAAVMEGEKPRLIAPFFREKSV